MLNQEVWTRAFAAILAMGVIGGSGSAARVGEDESEKQGVVAKLLPTAKISLLEGVAVANSNRAPNLRKLRG